MGFFKHFIFKIFLISSVGSSVGGPLFPITDYSDQVTSYAWVQDSNHQWILTAKFGKADLDTYFDKGPSSEGLGISVENRPTKQVFVYYPAGRSYSGQTYVSYDCQFEQPIWYSDITSSFNSTKGKMWHFFYKDMSIPKMEHYDETDPQFLYTGYARTFIEESLWYKKGSNNKETLLDSDFYICYLLSEAAPNKSFWGRLKYQISKFFKFSETDYEIALKEEAKKKHEEFEKKVPLLKPKKLNTTVKPEDLEVQESVQENPNQSLDLEEQRQQEILEIKKKYGVKAVSLD